MSTSSSPQHSHSHSPCANYCAYPSLYHVVSTSNSNASTPTTHTTTTTATHTHTAASTASHAQPIAAELDPHLDYTKLFHADKLRTTPLALCSLRTFASLAPQAAKVAAVYGYVGLPLGMWRLHLSPALWWVVGERMESAGQSGSRFDERHKVRLDQEDKHVEVDVKPRAGGGGGAGGYG